jgi:murein L,D-transpeptidase YcbB/YkuD
MIPIRSGSPELYRPRRVKAVSRTGQRPVRQDIIPQNIRTDEVAVNRTSAIGLVLLLGTAPAALAEAAAEPSIADFEATVSAALDRSDERDRIEAALEAALPADLSGEAREAILAFHTDQPEGLFWTAEGERAEALIAALHAAERHGLPVARYAPAELRERLAADADPLAAEIALSRAFLLYAGDMKAGLLVPGRVDPEINISPDRPSPATLLDGLRDQPLVEALAALEPDRPEYNRLIAEKDRLTGIALAGGWGERVPEGPALRRGDDDPRVAALRARLAALGHPAEGEGEVFDAALEAALKGFQAANGLVDDGILGRETLAALNASPEDRIGQILVNLERMRWLPDHLGDRYVLVNIPAYTVSVFEAGERVYHTRSIVGEMRTQTPEFSDTMTYLVVNPTWYIPDSIARRVYLPKLRQDPNVLRDNDMRLFTRQGTEIDPGLVDFAELGDSFPFRVRQNPSASNALGRVKFMFPNQFSIYLHDTPNRELFDRDARAFSNGCVRLAKPFELAHYLLAPQLDDPEAQFQAWLDAGSERYVTLEAPIAVHLVYRTAWADEEGIHFRRDIYGRDARVLAALAERGVTMPAARTAAAEREQTG